jgi:hypothetical protein
MKLNPFSHRRRRSGARPPKPVPVAPAPQRSGADPQPRVWSLLLPPGYTHDRH